MKKLIALLVLVAMTVTMFAGCGNNKTTDEDVTEVVLWTSDSHAKRLMDELVNEFNNTIGKDNKVKLVHELKENSGQELEVALQNGKEPDLFGGGTLSKMAENNQIVPLTDIPEIADVVAKNSDVNLERQNAWGGKMYLMAVSSQVYGLAYNKDLFKEAGLVDEKGEAKPPVTIDEVREYAKKLTKADKQQYGIIFPGKWSGWVGCELINTSLNTTGSMGFNFQKGEYDYNGIKPMLELMLNLKKDGSVYPGMEGLDNDPARARFAEGNIGMKFAVSWDVGVWNDQFPAKCDWGIAPLPVVSTDEMYYQYKSPSWSYYISRRNIDEKGTKPVSLVFNYLYSDEILQRMYEEGIYLPWRSDIIDGANVKAGRTGWKDFGDIVTISTDVPPTKPADTSAYDTISNDILNRVWTEKISVEDWIAERNKIQNEGIKIYNSLHPEFDYSDRVYPDFDIRRK